MISRHPTRRAIGRACTGLMLAFASVSPVHAQDAGVDADVRPGDDFFRYANGAWLKSASIPAGKPSYGARAEIAERTQQQLIDLLEQAKAARKGTDARKVADFRAAYLDEKTIEARGLAPIKPLLARIDRIGDKAALARALGSGLRADVDPLNWGIYESSHVLGLAVQAGIHGEKEYVAYLVQGGLGLGSRDDYLGTDAAAQDRRAKYEAAVSDVLARLANKTAAAAPEIRERAAAVLQLETAIAHSHATPEASDDELNANTLWTRDDFARKAPGMDWDAFFASAGLARQRSFVPWQPGAVKGLAALVASADLRAWKDYLRVRVVATHAGVLPRSFCVEPLATSCATDRSARAAQATLSAMSDEVGKLYVQRYFPPAQKARVQAIAANVIAAFTRRVQAAEWMTPATRMQALAKLKTVRFGIGYPERWPVDPPLRIDASDAAGNVDRVAQRNYARSVARLGKPVDRSAWEMPPQRPGAILIFIENSYNFAAALLQAPKFDASASDAASYGAIGAIVGHEVSHFVDTLGAEYEVDGRRRKWWTDADVERYNAVTEPLVRQFSAYLVLDEIAVDGRKGLTENLADLGGLAAAFDAYRLALGDGMTDAESVRRMDREFFIGFARAWRVKYTDDALRKQAASDHSPEPFRVSTVRNIDAWYDAFDVQPGQRLYLPPQSRVRVW